MWSSFIGFNPDNTKGIEGLFPILLWPEQNSYLSGLPDVKKRQRDDECTAAPPQKRNRTTATAAIAETLNGVVDFMWRKCSDILKPSNRADSVQTIGGVLILPDDDGSGVVTSSVDTVDAGRTRDVKEEAGVLNEPTQNDCDETIIGSESRMLCPKDKVYSDLQQKGYLVAPGDVYGGDYCLYQGAVSESHSLATVRIVAESRKISARDFLAFTRVQNQVAKSAVFAFIDPETEQASYIIANFKGVSDRG